jgi:hypothetical protein
MFAERDDDFRLDDVELPFEMRLAVGHLVPGRIAVSFGTALDDVADVDVLPTHLEPLDDHVGEELPRTADERNAGGVFIGAGGFADETDFRVRAAVGEDGARPAGDEFRAANALGDFGGENRQRFIFVGSRRNRRFGGRSRIIEELRRHALFSRFRSCRCGRLGSRSRGEKFVERNRQPRGGDVLQTSALERLQMAA